jgi:hypothetical protein
METKKIAIKINTKKKKKINKNKKINNIKNQSKKRNKRKKKIINHLHIE